jgi:hypothetical protein
MRDTKHKFPASADACLHWQGLHAEAEGVGATICPGNTSIVTHRPSRPLLLLLLLLCAEDWLQKKAVAERVLRVFVRNVDYDNMQLANGVRIFVAEAYHPAHAPPAVVDPVLQVRHCVISDTLCYHLRVTQQARDGLT